jgi:hypothetical protein
MNLIQPQSDDVIIHFLGRYALRGTLRESFSLTQVRCGRLFFDLPRAERAGRELAAERRVALWFEDADRRLSLVMPRLAAA